MGVLREMLANVAVFLKHLEATRIAGGGFCNFLQCWQKLAAQRAQTQRRRIDFVMNKGAGEFSNQDVQPVHFVHFLQVCFSGFSCFSSQVWRVVAPGLALRSWTYSLRIEPIDLQKPISAIPGPSLHCFDHLWPVITASLGRDCRTAKCKQDVFNCDIDSSWCIHEASWFWGGALISMSQPGQAEMKSSSRSWLQQIQEVAVARWKKWKKWKRKEMGKWKECFVSHDIFNFFNGLTTCLLLLLLTVLFTVLLWCLDYWGSGLRFGPCIPCTVSLPMLFGNATLHWLFAFSYLQYLSVYIYIYIS